MKQFLITATFVLIASVAKSQDYVINPFHKSTNRVANVPTDLKTIDLGLTSGTLWSNINLGANSVTDYGKYFSWGETNSEERSDFYQNKDPLYKVTQNTYVNDDGFTVTETKAGYTKYVYQSDADQYGYEGFFDNKDVLEKEDDAAYVLWGEEWMIPTVEQWRELETECTWESVTWNDINGFKVTGKNNNYIFIPKGGYNYEGWYHHYVGEYTCYWSSSLSNSSNVAEGHVNTGNPYSGVGGSRFMGRLIRPVSVRHEQTEKKKCEKPTIGYSNGKLTFSSSTEDATCYYSITDTDIKSGSGSEVQLGVTYNISVFATKSGYENSETATATLCWIDATPQTEGITNGIANIPAQAVLIQSEGGSIKVQGVDEGTQVNVYSVNGTQVGTAISQNGAATVNTTLQQGSVAIIKVGKKSIKVMMK